MNSKTQVWLKQHVNFQLSAFQWLHTPEIRPGHILKLWSLEIRYEHGCALGLACPSYTYTYPSVRFTITQGCSPRACPLLTRYFWWEENAILVAVQASGDRWWKVVQAWRATDVGGRHDGLRHWLLISFWCKQMFPCPARVLACTDDWASNFCHWLAAHNLWGTGCQVILTH